MLGCTSHYYKFPACITRSINSKYYSIPYYYIIIILIACMLVVYFVQMYFIATIIRTIYYYNCLPMYIQLPLFMYTIITLLLECSYIATLENYIVLMISVKLHVKVI